MRSPFNEFKSRIEFYKRSKDFNPHLLEKIVKQAEKEGLEYVLSCVSEEARRFYSKARLVMGECHRAKGFLRFNELGGTLIAKTDFDHDVVDMVLVHFMARFPQHKVVILCNSKAYVGEKGLIRVEKPYEYDVRFKEKDDKRDELWETFYDSQYIAARRNRKLAMKAVPKKLWKKFGIKEGRKIDKGIFKKTLEDY